MKNYTVKKQLFLFALLMVVFQVILGAISYTSLKSLQSNLTSVFSKRLPSIDNLVQADRDFQQALVAERTLLVNGLSSDIRKTLAEDYYKNRKQVSERFQVYKQKAETPEELELIKKFESHLAKWNETSDELLQVKDDGNFKLGVEHSVLVARSMNYVNKDFETARTDLDMLQEKILALGSQEYNQALGDYNRAETLTLGFAVFGFLCSLILSWLMAKNVSGKLTHIVNDLSQRNNELTSISTELAQKSTALASSSQEQASSVTETSSSLHEISQMIENNSVNTEKSTTLVLESEHLIEKGMEKLESLKRSIGSVENASEEMANSITRNNDDLELVIQAFKQIKDKTNVINDIVFQTKLLSFNASVEAARAGVHGKGFSVVAEEIGNLAQESGTSALEITNLLEESLNKVSSLIEKSKKELESSVNMNKQKIQESVKHSQECNESFVAISEKFTSVSEASNEVNEASKEQETGVAEINRAMQEINASNEITSQSANRIEHSSQQLTGMVDQITKNISLLEELVGLSSGLSQLQKQNTVIIPSNKAPLAPVATPNVTANSSSEVEWTDLDDDDFSQSA